jgi:hypothetical protein
MMCNIWTNEHVFIWYGNSTSDGRTPEGLVCRCGAFRYDGKPANITINKELKLFHKPLTLSGELEPE